MKKVCLFSKKEGAGRKGAALYLTVTFVTIAVGLLLILFSISSSSAVASANAVRKLKNDLIAESAAEELRCALISCDGNAASLDGALDAFIPSDIPDGFEVEFSGGEVSEREDCVVVSDCAFTVTKDGETLSELKVSYKIKSNDESSSGAEKVVYFNVGTGE